MSPRTRFRLSLALLILSVLVLVDEYAKEGYVFDFRDIYITFPTHEQIFLILLLLGLLFGVRKR